MSTLVWHPIDTAPKDGTEIIVLKQPSASWERAGEYPTKWGKLKDWDVWDWLIDGFPEGTWGSVTHWRPKP